MTPQEQIPFMDEQLKKIDAEIEQHIGVKFRLLEELQRVNAQLDYRERRIRELGAERSRIATFSLDL